MCFVVLQAEAEEVQRRCQAEIQAVKVHEGHAWPCRQAQAMGDGGLPRLSLGLGEKAFIPQGALALLFIDMVQACNAGPPEAAQPALEDAPSRWCGQLGGDRRLSRFKKEASQ